jgi:DNA-binding NarL/FixJ family response regulator
LTTAASERLREHTDGHPLYVKALLSELPLDTLNLHGGPLPAPRSFAATVLARLTNIGADAQSLVASAAVAGVRCQLALAGAVAGLADPGPALEEALGAELLALVPARVPEEISFPHPLLRAAVRDDLSPARRRALHLSWSEHTTGSDALAHRVAASHGSDDALAAELQATAEAEVEAGRLAAGVERLLWSSRIAESPAKKELGLLRAVECLLLAGDVPEANSRRDAVLQCSDSPRRSFTVAALTASVGLLPQAEATLRDVVARPDFGLYPELEGPVASALAVVYGFLAQASQAIQWAQRAMQAPGASPTVEVTARQALVLGLTMEGRGDEAIAGLEHLSASRIDPAPYEAELLATRGNAKVWWGDLVGATEDLGTVIRWSRAGAHVRGLPNAYSALAQAEYHLGRWDEGLTHAEVAVPLAEDSDRTWDLPFVHAVAAHLHAGRGNWRAASEHVQSARRAAERAPLAICVYYACNAAANAAWVRTEWDDVLRALEPLYQHPGAGRALGMGHRIPRLMHIEAMISTGRLEEAAGALEQLETATTVVLGDVTRIEYWRLRGELERASERSGQAQLAFARAAQAAAVVASPFYGGLLKLSHGRFLHRTGDRREAIEALRTARRQFEELGATPFVGRCDAELAACGVRSRRQDGDDRWGLTAREELVARLVASGKSNREVAEELYLSTKAIEYHLSNVFAKVNVRSRHDLASRLNASGVQPPA